MILTDTAPQVQGLGASAADQRKLTVTRFSGIKYTAGKASVVTWPALCRTFDQAKERPHINALPLFKAARLKDDSRAAPVQVLAVDALCGDYDAGKVTIEEAAGRLKLAGIRAILYTTRRHAPGAPRWRVVAPLNATIKEPEHRPLMDLLNGALGGVLATESWEWSRCYFYGRVRGVEYECRVVDGEQLDVVAACPDFDPIPSAAPIRPASARRGGTGAGAGTGGAAPLGDVGRYMVAKGLCTGRVGNKLFTPCPKKGLHSGDNGPSESAWMLADTGGYELGHFVCQHKWHEGHGPVTDAEFKIFIGYDTDPVDDFGPVEVTDLQAAESTAAAIRNARKRAVSLEDFYAHGPDHKFIHRPTRALWPAASVDGMVYPWPTVTAAGKSKPMPPSRWLDQHQAVQQMTWLPGAPEVIENKIMLPSGWAPRPGARVYNRYLPPPPFTGDAALAGPWLEHGRRLYPGEWDQMVNWFAHRLQRPGEKVNNALVLGGDQGIGKDSILVPVKAGVGASNVEDIAPAALMGGFNGFAASVLLVVSEARNLGEHDRFELYEQSKTYICAPPDVLRVNEKHLREYYVPNLCGVIFTTNHRTSGLYLPADDRRHFVAWSEANRAQFEAGYFANLYRWYAAGGVGHVLAYLHAVDLSAFDPKAEPPKTAAFWAMVQAGEAPESSELRSVIEAMGAPVAITVRSLALRAAQIGMHDLSKELLDRKTRARLPHMLDRIDYVSVHNPDNKRGRFGAETVYAKKALSFSEQVRAARETLAAPSTGGGGFA